MKINKIEKIDENNVIIKVRSGPRWRNIRVIKICDKWLLKCTKRDVTDMVDEALLLNKS